MLRPIWSHPEWPTKEDIRDELRRSERNRGLKPATSISGVPVRVRSLLNSADCRHHILEVLLILQTGMRQDAITHPTFQC